MNTDYKKAQFEKAIREGLSASSSLILKTSAKCALQVKDAPIGELAVNVDETLNTFVTDKSENDLMRFSLMADGIVNLIVKERSQKFDVTYSANKVRKLGEAFGFMTGMAVLTTVVKVFLLQATGNLKDREDLSEDAKSMCVNYINDVFTVILMTLSSELDSTYKTSKKERIFFSNLLSENDWSTLFNKNQDNGEVTEKSIVEA